jgi:hypothetical protein
MPLTLLLVLLTLLLGLIVGGVVACRGVTRAEDGYEDDEGFHPCATLPAPDRTGARAEHADVAGAGY